MAVTSALFPSPRCKYYKLTIAKNRIEILSLKFIITVDVLFKINVTADIYHCYIEERCTHPYSGFGSDNVQIELRFYLLLVSDIYSVTWITS